MDGLREFVESLSDRYQIEREIGRGGMATVYLAEDRKHHRKVAIKVLAPGTEVVTGAGRFVREIEIAARLNHPHVLALYDSGDAGDHLYYVMPFVEGESLRARLDREKQLPLEDALRLAREIASALGHAHNQGLVHRDIKPENILLSDGIALVADFGIARVVSMSAGRGLTTTGTMIGTPAYMSPEQVLGSADVDGRADLYSLGCVLYEMLSGEPPFTGPTALAILYQHEHVTPRPVTDLQPSVPAGVAAELAKVLGKSPADRHATAAHFAEALASAVRGGTPPAAVTETATPNNLPRQRTRFIGRENELAACARLLRDTRLLTLTGIGGCGKTRIAIKLAENLLESYPDGVWFVDLAPLNDADRVVLTTAIALGVREDPGTPLIDTLTRHVSARRALIVLDNCEHVLGAAGDLVDALLEASSDLKLVVTSREGLGVAGEQVFSVRSLSLPSRGKTADAKGIEASDAVRLFVDRARGVEPRFNLDATNAQAIAEICRRLDGIPLAIELAAARVKVLTVEQIQAKLDDRFRLLTGGSKTALARHQTLRATIQWSYDHLSGEEQRLFRVLAVFSGGWTLEAATRVVGEEADDFAVLDTIERLVDKSLVGLDREGSEARYTMLETVRQYAQERLKETGEGDVARTRHLGFYLALAEEAEPNLMGPLQGEWSSRLDRERENLLLANAWCDRAAEGVEQGLRLVSAVRGDWLRRGLLEQGYRVTVEALERAGANGRSQARCGALLAAGHFGLHMGRYDEAKEYLEESLSIAQELRDEGRAADALRQLGAVSQGQGDVATARGYLERGLALARELGDTRRLAVGLNALAELQRAEGELESAAPLYEEAVALHRKRGDHDNLAVSLLNLAVVSVGRGAEDWARRMLLEAFGIANELGSKYVGQFFLDVSAGLGASLGEWERAARLVGAAEAQMELMGFHRDPVDEVFIAPLIARAREALGEVAFATAKAAGRALSYEEAMAEARALLG